MGIGAFMAIGVSLSGVRFFGLGMVTRTIIIRLIIRPIIIIRPTRCLTYPQHILNSGARRHQPRSRCRLLHIGITAPARKRTTLTSTNVLEVGSG